MDKLTFNEWSTISDLQTIVSLKEDEEFSMARGELKTAQDAVKRLMGKLKGEGNLEAWVQSKITKAAEYLDTVADHLSHGEDDTERTSDMKEAVLGRYKEDKGGGKSLRPASERIQSKKSEEQSEPEGPKVTKLKRREPRKGEATASQVQGWRGSDRTNTNRRGQTAPQAKAAMKEEFKGHKSVEEIAKKHKVSPSVIQKQLEMGMKVEHEHTTDNDQAMDIALQHLDEIPDYYSKLKKVEKVQEMISTSAQTGRRFRDISSSEDQRDLEKERSKRKKEKQEKYKKSLESLRDQTRERGIRFYDKKGSGYIKDGQKQYDESVEILDANGNVFAHVIDIIRGSDHKFKSFVQSINEDAVEELENKLKTLNNTSYDSIDNLMRRIMEKHSMSAKELHNAFVTKHDKTPDEWIKDLNEKCWDGYKQLGMKKKGGKVVPNCVKEDSVEEVYLITPQKKSTDTPKKKETWYERDARKAKEKKLRRESTEVQEGNKSGDSSLRDWFTKSRSSDGTPGWVQLGGKYAGKPCAKQPGQTTKPKCGSSKMKSDLSDKEEESAFRRKNQEDPNPERKGKAKMVATEEKDACYSKVKSRYSVWPSAYASGALVKCRKVGAKNWGNKTKKESFELQEMGEVLRYCPKCKKNETMQECRYGEEYWKMFSIPASLAPDPYDPNDIHPANEGVSFEIGSGHKQAQKQTKIRNLAIGTTNPNEKSAALKKLSGPSLPLADCVIQPGQLTTEDYQRIQSTGNVYTILFSWRGRPMMNLQLFFPSMNRPSKEEVKTQIEKLYPGAVIMQWHPSPTDPSKPIIVIQK